MRSYIKVSNELRKELQEKFGKTRRSVYSALMYITSGDSANAIRAYALSHGGQYEEEDFIPNCKTRHEGDLMIQSFKCGVVVTLNKKEGSCVVTRNGAEVKTYDNLTMRGWSSVLADAQALSEKLVKASARINN